MKQILHCFLPLLFLLVPAGLVFSQTSLQGKVIDAESQEPIIFGNVVLYKNQVYITGVESDLDGNYSFSNIDPGTYDLEVSYTGYQSQRVEGILVAAGKVKTHLNG